MTLRTRTGTSATSLLLSNGHCVPVRYAAMAEAGYFDKQGADDTAPIGFALAGTPGAHALAGLENTSGPLGCGISQACGMALAMRMDSQKHRWIYVVTGDGEQDEGNIWEGAMLAGKEKLSNIIAITDRNNIQIDGPTEQVMPLEDLKAKWQAFGWHVMEVDGNNIEAFIDACAMGRAIENQPVMIIAHTIPGKGVDFMENDFAWHGKPPDQEKPKKPCMSSAPSAAK